MRQKGCFFHNDFKGKNFWGMRDQNKPLLIDLDSTSELHVATISEEWSSTFHPYVNNWWIVNGSRCSEKNLQENSLSAWLRSTATLIKNEKCWWRFFFYHLFWRATLFCNLCMFLCTSYVFILKLIWYKILWCCFQLFLSPDQYNVIHNSWRGHWDGTRLLLQSITSLSVPWDWNQIKIDNVIVIVINERPGCFL